MRLLGAIAVIVALVPPATVNAVESVALVKDINPSTDCQDASPTGLTNIGGTLFFNANDGTAGTEPWESDGTEAGTATIKDINTSGSSNPEFFTDANGTAYFRANDATTGRELWKSDGTASGTALVKDINTAGDGMTGPPVYANGIVFFFANDGSTGSELWKSDGTEAGTVIVKDILSGSSSSSPGHLTAVGNRVFFKANDGTNGMELWTSDGTEAGTVMVEDIWAGSFGSVPHSLIDVGGTLYFAAADDGTSTYNLWKSDGTDTGTTLVKNIEPAENNVFETDTVAAVGTTLFFVANDGTHGYELWKSDGTASGTFMVKDILTGSTGSVPSDLAAVGSTLYFVANDGTHGRELWKSDGSAAGTVLVKDLRAGSDFSDPEFLTNVGGTLFFRAYDGVGFELWRSDGTTDGTVLVSDLNQTDSGGVNSGNAYGPLTAVGTTLYFVGDDGETGCEVWRTVTSTNSPPSVDAGPDVAGSEGSAVALDATVTDTDGDTVATTWSVPAGTPCTFAAVGAVDTTITCTNNGTFTATLTGDDGVNDPVSDTTQVTVANAAPVATITAPTAGSQHTVGATVDMSASFTDAGTSDTHTCSIDWGDGSAPSAGMVTESGGSGSCSGSHSYGAAGSYTISVTITDDDSGSDTETISIEVISSSGGGGGSEPSPSPSPSPQIPTLSIDDASVFEGDSGTTAAVFTVTRSADNGSPTSVSFTTQNMTATAGADYDGASGTVSFGLGELTRTISIVVHGDVEEEEDETFSVILRNPQNGTLARQEASGTIRNDDGPIIIKITETIGVTDTPDILPAALIFVSESIGVTDTPGLLPAAMISVTEEIGVTDEPGVFPMPMWPSSQWWPVHPPLEQ